jgi:hypothetical protein
MRDFKRLLIAALGALALAGCGGGGGGGPTGPGITADPLASGRAALNKVATGASPADNTTLQAILQQFQQALQQNPGSAQAQFGIALCLAGVAGNDLDGSGGGAASSGTVSGGIATVASGGPNSAPGSPPALPSPPTTGELPPAPPGHTLPVEPLPPVHHLSLLWNLDSSLANPYALLNMLAPVGSLQYGIIPYYGYSQDAGDVARRQKLLATLNTVTQNLQAVEAVPGFSTTLPDPNRQGQQVAVGLPEVYLFDAYVNSLRAEVALSLAYVRDPGGVQLVPTPVPASGSGTASPEPAIFAVASGNTGSGVSTSPSDPATIYAALDKNHDGKLTPDEYLPASPYLTLRDPALLATAQQAMQAVVDRETKGITGVLARPTDGMFLVSNTQEVKQTLTEVRDHVLPVLQQAATGPVTIELPHYQPLSNAVQSADPPPPPPGSNAGGVFSILPPAAPGGSEPPLPPVFVSEKVTVDLAAWFARPPADLKAFAPIYSLTTNGFPDLALTAYPDPTFGGLYPNGLPKDLVF